MEPADLTDDILRALDQIAAVGLLVGIDATIPPSMSIRTSSCPRWQPDADRSAGPLRDVDRPLRVGGFSVAPHRRAARCGDGSSGRHRRIPGSARRAPANGGSRPVPTRRWQDSGRRSAIRLEPVSNGARSSESRTPTGTAVASWLDGDRPVTSARRHRSCTGAGARGSAPATSRRRSGVDEAASVRARAGRWYSSTSAPRRWSTTASSPAPVSRSWPHGRSPSKTTGSPRFRRRCRIWPGTRSESKRRQATRDASTSPEWRCSSDARSLRVEIRALVRQPRATD